MICGGDYTMKCTWIFALALGAALASPASAQVSLYADFSVSKLTGGLDTQTTKVLVGPTIGLTAQITQKGPVKLYADLRGSFLGGSNRLDSIAFGPKIGILVRKFELSTEFLVGFARYNDGLGNPGSSSTDSHIQVNTALDRRVSAHFDWRIVEFGYEQYYGLSGEYNPKTFSTGVVFHFNNRYQNPLKS
jgi:hypothetical protein